MQRFILTGIVLVMALTMGCQPPETPTPILTVAWEDNHDGNMKFSTNDKTYYGYSFWHYWSNNDTGATFTTFTGATRRVSGNTDQGFGFIFCYSDNSNYHRLLITTTGWYAVQSVIGGDWFATKAWAESPYLLQGMNAENVIKVDRNSSGVFTLTFNDHVAGTFTTTQLTRDSYGMLATVGTAEDERFPTRANEVRARLTAPDPHPSSGLSPATTYSIHDALAVTPGASR